MRRVDLVPPEGWRILRKWVAGVRGGDVIVAVAFNPLSWTVGFDFWRAGGGLSLGPLAMAGGYYPDDEARP